MTVRRGCKKRQKKKDVSCCFNTMPVFCPPVDQSLAAQLAKLLSYPHFQCSLHSWACAQPEDLHISKGWVECKGKEERGVWLFLLHRRNLQGSERGEVWIKDDDEPAPEVVNILKLLSPYRMLFILQQRKAKCRISFPPGDETSSPDAQACTPGTTAEDDVLSLKDDGLKKKKKKKELISNSGRGTIPWSLAACWLTVSC